MYLLISLYTEDKKRKDQPDETRDTGDIWGPGGEGGGYWCLQLRQRDATMSPLQSLEEKKIYRYDKTAVNNLFSFTLLNYHWLFILVSVRFVYFLHPANTGIFWPLCNLFYSLWTSSWKSYKYIVFYPEIFKVHFNTLLMTWKHSYCHFMNYFQGVTHTPQSFAPSPHIPT